MERHSRLLLIAAPVVVVLFSLLQGAYDIDPHHWGLMLSNAKDLYKGQTPYKDIFIQYGILTTILQAFAFGVGKNMLSIIVITSVCYAIGILLVYAIALRVLKNKTIALYVLITLVLFHPLAMYPWSNYMAFPFLMAGIYFSITLSTDGAIDIRRSVLSGLFLGMAVLCREGLAPAVVLYAFFSFVFDWLRSDHRKNTCLNFVLMLLGFALPIGAFFVYLNSHGLVEYWINLAITLPRIYAQESFGSLKTFIFQAIFKEIYTGYRHADIRWVLVSLMIVANLYILIVFTVKRKLFFATTAMAKIALASLLLLSSALHLAEIFRIATASSVGLIGLYAYLESKSWAKSFFIFIALWLGLTATYGNRGNYFFPTWETVSQSRLVESPKIFSGQLWTPEVANYYKSLDITFQDLQKLPCNIQYQKNNTRDSLVKVISPFEQLQLAPFQTSDKKSALRPDLDASAKIALAEKIILIETVESRRTIRSEDSPHGFAVYKTLSIPYQFFMPHDQKLIIYAPLACIKYH